MGKSNVIAELNRKTGYRWTHIDPVVADTVGMMDELEKKGISYVDIAYESGVSKTTLYAWASAKVKRPQFITLSAVWKVMVKHGKERAVMAMLKTYLKNL